MKRRNVVCLLALFGCIMMSRVQTSAKEVLYVNSENPYLSTSSRYDYVYANPPRQSIATDGRYIILSSKVRYVHSPSRIKRAKQAARINAYNYYYNN